MNKGTLILLLVLSINLVSYGFAYSCSDAGGQCGENFDNSVIRFFFDAKGDTNLMSVDGLNVNETLRKTMEDSLEQEPGVATATDQGAIGFLDVVKMTIGFVALFTPFPILLMLYSFGIPLLFAMLLFIPIFALYSVSIYETIRGVQF